jgi:GT2 family glycosyltransferase
MSNPRTVIVSVLNWNTAQLTADCVASILKLEHGDALRVQVVVLDNGSRADDWQQLQASLDASRVTLVRQERNLGFAGGHNVTMRMAVEQNAEFVWLVNSDSILEPSSLSKLVAAFDADPRCGAASPVIRALHDERLIDFCGARHDWKNLDSIRSRSVEEAQALEAQGMEDMWLAGTLVMFRVEALKQVGLLNEKLFAYFEDDDIGVRLSRGGWHNRLVAHASAWHAQPNVKERGPHYFYLLYRNSFLFYLEHTPAPYRRLIRLRLIDRALFTANRLYRKGHDKKAEACLLGIVDGLRGRGGPPDLERQPPLMFALLRKLLLVKHYRFLRQVEA